MSGWGTDAHGQLRAMMPVLLDGVQREGRPGGHPTGREGPGRTTAY
nr:hypothetical protein [Micromonospora acroterricola]